MQAKKDDDLTLHSTSGGPSSMIHLAKFTDLGGAESQPQSSKVEG